MYKHLEHPADIYIEVYGRNLEEIFRNAALALYDQICEIDKIENNEIKKISIEAAEYEDLLVNFLNEILYLFDSEGFVASSVEVRLTDKTLIAILSGEKYRREKHGVKHEIKATTYHGLVINPSEGYARILFDI